MMHFSSRCLIRSGLDLGLGSILGAKIDPKSFQRLRVDGLNFDLVVGWSQDGSKTVPRGPKSLPAKEGPRAPKSALRNLNLSFGFFLGIQFVDSIIASIQ